MISSSSSSLNETIEREEREELEKEGGGSGSHSSLKSLLWHGGSAYDAWFNCASNQLDCLFDKHSLH
ncbi:hypothetical protein HN51_070123 [Arachis hypogaea]